MSDVNTKIDAANQEIAALQGKIEEVRKSKAKQAKTLSQAAKASTSGPILGIRTPPAVKIRRTLKGHFGKVSALHWSGDSRLLVSASHDGNLLIWNAITNNKLQAIGLKSSYVMAVGMEQSKGNLVACGGLDNLCSVYRLTNPNQPVVEMASHEGFLSCCRFLDEERIVTSSGDATCILWDVAKATPVSTFVEHTEDIMFVALNHHDRSIFASCSVDLSTKIWDIRTTPDKAVQSFQGFHTADINAVEFMPSNPHAFATCGQDNTVRLFDLRAYNELAVFSNGTDAAAAAAAGPSLGGVGGYTSVTFSKSGRLVFCGDSEGNILAFDVLAAAASSSHNNNNNAAATKPAYTIAAAHERNVSCLGMSPAGDALCTGGWDGLLKIWA